MPGRRRRLARPGRPRHRRGRLERQPGSIPDRFGRADGQRDLHPDGLADGINDGRYLKVDASGYPDTSSASRLRARSPPSWYRDGDGDGYGDYDHRLQVCDGSTPDGYVNDDFTDCDDDRGRCPTPACPRLPCDGLDNDCDGVVDVEAPTMPTATASIDICDAFPNDPDRSGPLPPRQARAPSTTCGRPSPCPAPTEPGGHRRRARANNDGDPGVIQIDGVTARGFDIRFAEWNYQDGFRNAPESVPYIVMERGRYVMDDGSIWEFGTFDIPQHRPLPDRESSRRRSPAPPALFLSPADRQRRDA